MNITLIGMPGVGKSLIGRKLAEKLGFSFLDADEIIERKAKISLQKIIDIYGEDQFLSFEKEAILNLPEIEDHVICPGGSVVYSQEAMQILEKKSFIVFLDCDLEDLKKRIPDLENRGIVGIKDKTLEDISAQRMPLYKKYANYSLKIKDIDSFSQYIKEIIHAVSRR